MCKQIIYITSLVCAAITALLFASCQNEELFTAAQNSKVEIVCRVSGFAEYDVTTRAAKNEQESAIKYMALFIFDGAGHLINKQQIESSVPMFVIDRNDLLSASNATDVRDCRMYLIANMSPALVDSWGIDEESDILDKTVALTTSTTSLDIPANGFPMVGSTRANLHPDNDALDGKIEIPLENLYAKIVFELKVDAVQEYFTPTFRLISWEVHNLPKAVSMFAPEIGEQTQYYKDTIANYISSRRVTGVNPISGSNTLEFSFYMPEHKVKGLDRNTYNYPDGISENEMQRFKPCLVDRTVNPSLPAAVDGEPAYVVINGMFTDHQSHQHAVTYKLYLGANSIDDFNVVRNCQYNNYVSIKGATNSVDGDENSVSIDYRVNVDNNDFVLFMERETMLDSHFEVRPIRVDLHNPGKVNIRVSDGCNWIRLEKKSSAPAGNATYCTNGKRKYFTTGLVTNTLAASKSCEITNNVDNCVWVYIDENSTTIQGAITDEKIEAQKHSTREAQIIVEFTPQGETSPTIVKSYNFVQRALYPVKSVKRAGVVYYIEFFEEYLHNFDSEDNFGLTDYEGMPWGLDGLQISSKNQAAFIDPASESFLLKVLGWIGINTKEFLDESIGQLAPKYDFYLQRDYTNGMPDNIIRNYSGYDFTKEIVRVAKDNNKFSAGTLDVDPNSAVEYCYNKNRRDDGTGALSEASMHWYMPATDELEDIVQSAYTEFNVFQDKFYWSSQPSFVYSDFIVNVQVWIFNGSATGKYYDDDVARARSTKIAYDASQANPYVPVSSGVSGPAGQQPYEWGNPVRPGTYVTYPLAPTPDVGNKLRTEKCRVRAVYKP